MVSFLDYGGTDPASAAQEAGEAITNARKEVEARGIKAFLFNAVSPEEFDERASIREVAAILDGISDSYLNSREGHAKLASVLRSEFTAKIAADKCGDCPAGTKCVCTHDDCKCVKTAQVNNNWPDDMHPIPKMPGESLVSDGSSCDTCGQRLNPEKGEAFLTDDGGVYCNDHYPDREDSDTFDNPRDADLTFDQESGVNAPGRHEFEAPEGHELCPTCGGSGESPNADPSLEPASCLDCGGSGTAHDHSICLQSNGPGDYKSIEEQNAAEPEAARYRAEKERQRSGPQYCGRCQGTAIDPAGGGECPECNGSGLGKGHTAKTKEADIPMSDPIARSECPSCGTEVTTDSLRDEASQREAAKSGMCQSCQDDYFGLEKSAQAAQSDEPEKRWVKWQPGVEAPAGRQCDTCGDNITYFGEGYGTCTEGTVPDRSGPGSEDEGWSWHSGCPNRGWPNGWAQDNYVPDTCPKCDGAGMGPDQTCTWCKGSGEKGVGEEARCSSCGTSKTCVGCNGTGEYKGKTCETCDGTGDCHYCQQTKIGLQCSSCRGEGHRAYECDFCDGSGEKWRQPLPGETPPGRTPENTIKNSAIEVFPVDVEYEEPDRTPRLPDWVIAAIEMPVTAVKKTSGADTFETIGQGKTAEEAFQRAREDAAYEHGHGGYTGTIAEKGGFRLFNPPKGVKPDEFIKGFHEFSQRVWDAGSTQNDNGSSYVYDDKPVNYMAIGDSRPDVKECRNCGSKYQAPPKGTRKPPAKRQYTSETMWVGRGDSAKFKEENPDFKTTWGNDGGSRAYDGPSPYKAELDATVESRMKNRNWNNPTPVSDREDVLREKHKEHVDKSFHEAGGDQMYSPFREGVCHNCGHKPLRQEKALPVEQRQLYGQMHETYDDKWGDAVAVPLGKGQYHFMGYASS